MAGTVDRENPGDMNSAIQNPGQRLRTFLSVCAFLSVLLILCIRGAPLLNIPGNPTTSKWVLGDFRDVVYYPTTAFVRGENPYDEQTFPTNYPVRLPFSPYSPLLFLVHLPFPLMPHFFAQFVYSGISVGLTLVLAWCTLWMCKRRISVASVFGLGALFLACRPNYQNLLSGQISLEFVLAVYLALYLGASSPWIGAIAFAVATQKPTFGIPLLLILLIERRFRAAFRGVGIAAIATIVPTVVLVQSAGGIGPLVGSMLGSVGWKVGEFASPFPNWNRLDGLAIIHELFGFWLSGTGQLVFFSAVMALAGAALVRVRRIEGSNSADLYCLSIASLAILVAAYQHLYSAVLLVLPLTALVLGDSIPAKFKVEPALRCAMIGLLSVPMVNYVSSWTVFRNLEPGSALWRALASINGATLLMAFVLYVLIPFRPRHPA
jgi:hypothetical protein